MTKSGINYREPKVLDPPEPLCEGDGPFRPNVAALVLRDRGAQILLGERVTMPDAWQWPQGGMDPGESPEECLRRELKEEIGTNNINILYQFPFGLRYRFPERLGRKFHPRVGQEQIYFIVSLNEEPDLDRALDKEFRALRWMPFDEALDAMIWFKRSVGEAALEHARQVMADLDW